MILLRFFKLIKVSAGPVCSICTTVLTAAQGLLEQNKTEVNSNFFYNNFKCLELNTKALTIQGSNSFINRKRTLRQTR